MRKRPLFGQPLCCSTRKATPNTEGQRCFYNVRWLMKVLAGAMHLLCLAGVKAAGANLGSRMQQPPSLQPLPQLFYSPGILVCAQSSRHFFQLSGEAFCPQQFLCLLCYRRWILRDIVFLHSIITHLWRITFCEQILFVTTSYKYLQMYYFHTVRSGHRDD